MIRVSNSLLKSACHMVSGSASKATTLPVVACLHIAPTPESTDKEITLTATNLESWMSITIPVAEMVDEEIDGVSIPASLFSALVSKLDSGQHAVLTTDKSNKIQLKSGGVHSSLLHLPGDEFPVTPSLADCGGVKVRAAMPAELFARMVRHAAMCASEDDTRPIIQAVHIEIHTDVSEIVFAATDTHRLATCMTPCSIGKEFSNCGTIETNIESSIMEKVAGIAANAEGDVSLTVYGNSSMRVDWETPIKDASAKSTVSASCSLYCRCIEGPYPNYRRVIPPHSDIHALVSRRDLQTCVSRVMVAAEKTCPRVTMDFTLHTHSVSLMCESSSIGKIEDSVEVSLDSGSIRLAVNGTYLSTGLSTIDRGEGVKFAMTQPLRPFMIYPISDDYGFDFMLLLMPMQLAD